MVPAKNTTVENDFGIQLFTLLSTCFAKLVELDSESGVRADRLAEDEPSSSGHGRQSPRTGSQTTGGNPMVKPGLVAAMKEVGSKFNGVIYQIRISL